MSLAPGKKVFTIAASGKSDVMSMRGVRALTIRVPAAASIIGVIGIEAAEDEDKTDDADFNLIYEDAGSGTYNQIYLDPQTASVDIVVRASVFGVPAIRLRTQVSDADTSIQTQSGAIEVTAWVKS